MIQSVLGRAKPKDEFRRMKDEKGTVSFSAFRLQTSAFASDSVAQGLAGVAAVISTACKPRGDAVGHRRDSDS
jgi:hypothetical protein